MTIWLISDTHFGEQPARRRKASGMDGDELDERIVRNWLEVVKPGDCVWHLGDIGKDWRRLAELPGEKRLILAHASDRKAAIRNSGIFAGIHETALIEHGGREFFLIHNPDQPRPGPAAGVIHGHHHYSSPEAGHYSVCVDHWNWGPVRLADVVERDSLYGDERRD